MCPRPRGATEHGRCNVAHVLCYVGSYGPPSRFDPCSVTVGIETAGACGIFASEEGDPAMTKPREPTPTVAFVDDYCAHYRAVFPNVRQRDQFTHLELGLVAETKRKSLPRLAQATKASPQAFHHFLAKAAWSVEALRAVRLELTPQGLRERPFILCIDETGDRKKGKTTDYAASQ